MSDAPAVRDVMVEHFGGPLDGEQSIVHDVPRVCPCCGEAKLTPDGQLARGVRVDDYVSTGRRNSRGYTILIPVAALRR